jgi:hypothetical protein
VNVAIAPHIGGKLIGLLDVKGISHIFLRAPTLSSNSRVLDDLWPAKTIARSRWRMPRAWKL